MKCFLEGFMEQGTAVDCNNMGWVIVFSQCNHNLDEL